MFESPEVAVETGKGFVANARDALDRKVIREEHLYVWQNQVATLDEFLVDSEPLQEHDGLADVRAEARDLKTALEKSIADFYEEELDDSPEVVIPALLEVGGNLYDEAVEALQDDVEDVSELPKWEEPLLAIKSWLADSEPYGDDETVHAARQDMWKAKLELERRIDEVVKVWKETDDAEE